MQNVLWQFENKKLTASFTASACVNNTHIQVGVHNGQLVTHTINQNENCQEQHTFNFNPQFDLVPSEFAMHHPAVLKPVSQYQFTHDIVLNAYSKNSHALPALLVHLGKAANHSHHVTTYLGTHNLTLVFTHLGKIMLANNYPITGIEEVIFFLSAIANQHGLSVNDLNYTLYTSQDHAQLQYRLADYISNIEYVQAQLPYETDKMCPLPIETFLLTQLAQCALPAEI